MKDGLMLFGIRNRIRIKILIRIWSEIFIRIQIGILIRIRITILIRIQITILIRIWIRIIVIILYHPPTSIKSYSRDPNTERELLYFTALPT